MNLTRIRTSVFRVACSSVALMGLLSSRPVYADDAPLKDLRSHFDRVGHPRDPDQLDEDAFLERCTYMLRAVSYCNWMVATDADDVQSYHQIATDLAPVLTGCMKSRLSALAQSPSDTAIRKIIRLYLVKCVNELEILDLRGAGTSYEDGTSYSIGGGQTRMYKLVIGTNSVTLHSQDPTEQPLTIPQSLLKGLQGKLATEGAAPFQYAESRELNEVMATAQRFATSDRASLEKHLEFVDPEHATALLKLAEVAATSNIQPNKQAEAQHILDGVAQAKTTLSGKLTTKVQAGHSLKGNPNKIPAPDLVHFEHYAGTLRGRATKPTASAPTHSINSDAETIHRLMRP